MKRQAKTTVSLTKITILKTELENTQKTNQSEAEVMQGEENAKISTLTMIHILR